MTNLNVLNATDLSSSLIDDIIDKLDDSEVESAVIMGFSTDEETSSKIESFSDELNDRLAKRTEERARKDEPETPSNLNDYISLADLPDGVRKRIMTAVLVKAIIGKESSWNDLLVSKDLLNSLKD